MDTDLDLVKRAEQMIRDKAKSEGVSVGQIIACTFTNEYGTGWMVVPLFNDRYMIVVMDGEIKWLMPREH